MLLLQRLQKVHPMAQMPFLQGHRPAALTLAWQALNVCEPTLQVA